MAKNNNNNKSTKPATAPKGFATDRKRLTKVSRIVAIVMVVAMVITTLFTWGIGLVD